MDKPRWRLTLGANLVAENASASEPAGGSHCSFSVWAPQAKSVEVHLFAPDERIIPLEPQPWSYFAATVPRVPVGSTYKYRLDRITERPDPASQYQPEGVHEHSAVVDRDFDWTDGGWRGLQLEDYVFYELHVGAFSPEGTFSGVERHLDYLIDLGITAIELMPVAQFPGGRNWGYDGVHLFAVQNTYGGPRGLKQLVNACHARGVAVVLDVVYNHLGPEGNYLADFGPYFSDRYRIGWGQAINFDGRDSDPVRSFFIDNALFWVTEFHIDALRLDAVHAIFDNSPRHILAEMAAAVRAQGEQLGREIHLFPEAIQNNPRVTQRADRGGYGLDAEWNEDFGRCMHATLTGERNGYFADYGDIKQLAKAYTHGYIFDGQYMKYRGRNFGASSQHTPAERFIVYAQTHDLTGNRRAGERLGHLTDFETQKLAAAAVILSPFLPLLFMGEEYGETAPFLYFISHLDPALAEAVREGRQQDFAGFDWPGEFSDPQDESTFQRSRLNHSLPTAGHHQMLSQFYKHLLALRKSVPALRNLSKSDMEVTCDEGQQLLTLRRWSTGSEVQLLLNFGRETAMKQLEKPGQWRSLLDSASTEFGGPGAAVIGVQENTVRLSPRSALLVSTLSERAPQ